MRNQLLRPKARLIPVGLSVCLSIPPVCMVLFKGRRFTSPVLPPSRAQVGDITSADQPPFLPT